MLAPRPALTRCLVVAVALTIGTFGAGAAGAAEQPGSGGEQRAQSDPAPGTSVPGADDVDQVGEVTSTDEAGTDAARRQADADLRAVWTVVAGLGLVAFGLLAMLVLYVRATSPARVAARQGHRSASGEARAAGEGGGDGDDRGDGDGRGHGEGLGEGLGDRDGDGEGDGDDGTRPAQLPTIFPELPPARAAPSGGRRTAPLPAVDDRPAARPEDAASSGRRSRPATPAGSEVAATPDRPEAARSRPRRVEGPPKKLATPDAERVLVRPGQAPIRVPRASAADPSPTGGTEGPPASPAEPADGLDGSAGRPPDEGR